MKTIGVLGGLGPQATMDFEARVHRVSQQLIPRPSGNGGYPPMIVSYYRHAPVLLDKKGHVILPRRPDPRLLEAAGTLGPLVDFLVLITNTPHVFQKEIEAAAGRELLSMIEVTLAEVRRRGWEKVGVVGVGYPDFYADPLQAMGIAVETASENMRRQLDVEIFKLMAGRETDLSTAFTREVIDRLRAKRVDGIILGCTEIPLLLRVHAEADDLLHPAALLAEAAVRHAIA